MRRSLQMVHKLNGDDETLGWDEVGECQLVRKRNYLGTDGMESQ